jgi:hypothetical protein
MSKLKKVEQVPDPKSFLLSESESQQFKQYEGAIEHGLKSFADMGVTLTLIRDARLYRADYPTFDAYCKERWDFRAKQAYRLIVAAEVLKSLSDSASVLPKTESQIRPLTILKKPQLQQKAWDNAVISSGGNVTALHVQNAVNELQEAQANLTVIPKEAYKYQVGDLVLIG